MRFRRQRRASRLVVVATLLASASACGSDKSSGNEGTADARAGGASDSGIAIDAAVAGGPDAVPSVDGAPADAGPPQTFYWADWTAATTGAPGTAAGAFEPPSGTVSVQYDGEVNFAQTAGGTNYWVPGEPYINAVTANAPDQPDIIGLVGGTGTTNTLTFDPPVSGVVMGLVSLGSPGANVKYDFDTPITLLSFGAGFWGNGVIEVELGDIISGSEGHGAIQFSGTVSSISWTIENAESWHGFTVGIPAQ